MKIFFLFLLFIGTQLAAQNNVTNRVTANVNIAAPPFDETVVNSATGVTGSSGNSCMEAFGSSLPDGTLRISTNSNECGLVNKPAASAFWFANFIVGGNSGVEIPMSFNFSISCNSRIVSILNPNCQAIATTNFSGRAYSTANDEGFSTQIAYERGALVLFNSQNLGDSEVSADIGIGISVGTEDIQVFEIGDDPFTEFLERYNALDPSEQNLDESVLEALSSNFSLSSLEFFSGEVSQSAGEILNLLVGLGIVDLLNIEVAPGVELGLAVTVGMNYDFNRQVNISTNNTGFIAGNLIANSASSTCGQTSASVDATNSFILESITIPDEFDHPDVDETQLYVEWNDIQYPIVRESEVTNTASVVPEELAVRVFPNPAQSFIQIATRENGLLYQARVYTTQGVIVQQEEVSPPFSREMRLSTAHLAPGVYFLELVTSQGRIKKKIIVQ